MNFSIDNKIALFYKSGSYHFLQLNVSRNLRLR
jgi:hypothetical protein